MSTFYLAPREGLVVLDPITGQPLPEGAEVADSAFWRRRLSDGDVVKAKPPAPPKAAKSKES